VRSNAFIVDGIVRWAPYDGGVPLVYDVRIAIDDVRAFEAFVAWLVDRHVDDVCDAAGCAADVVVLDPRPDAGPRAVHVRYRFASREAFEAYERDHAPRLRAEGLAELARHGVAPSHGATFTRSTGEIVSHRPRATEAVPT
jgi:hypothetical protein